MICGAHARGTHLGKAAHPPHEAVRGAHPLTYKVWVSSDVRPVDEQGMRDEDAITRSEHHAFAMYPQTGAHRAALSCSAREACADWPLPVTLKTSAGTANPAAHHGLICAHHVCRRSMNR